MPGPAIARRRLRTASSEAAGTPFAGSAAVGKSSGDLLDNLVALLQQTDFIRKWPQNRAPLLRLKDWIWHALFKPPTPEEQASKQRAFVQVGMHNVGFEIAGGLLHGGGKRQVEIELVAR